VRRRYRGSLELLGESEEEPFGAADVAEAVGVLVADDFAGELGAQRSSGVADASLRNSVREQPAFPSAALKGEWEVAL
jgi:hypothetical protein